MVEGNEEFYNKLLLDKHPYFFRHLYKETDRMYKKYITKFNFKIENKLKITLDELLKKEKLTPKESEMLNNYYKYLPIIDTPSTMNRVCKHIESVKFNIKESNKLINNDHIIYKYLIRNQDIDTYLLKNIEYEYVYFNQSDSNELMGFDKIENNKTYDDGIDDENNFFDNKYEIFRNRLLKLGNINDVVDAFVYLLYVKKKTIDKGLLWDSFGDIIIENIIYNFGNKVIVPCLDIHGNINYMNKIYGLKEVIINES